MTTLRKVFSHAVAIAALAMSLSCGEPLKTISIPTTPSELTTHTVSRHSSDHAGLPCIATGGSSDCSGEPPPGRLRVGFVYAYDCDDIVIKDCWRWQSCEARGFVRFDLSALKGKEIISATLKYDVLSNSTTTSRASCAASLFVAKDGSISFDTAGDLVTGDLPDSPSPTGSITVPVNNQVRNWVLGTVENFGFFIDGPAFLHDRRDGCDKVSEKCDSVLGNFSLKVEYTDK
ncbi:MAG TPA: hypothetical protein VFF31_26985 [Blastocatellia bacterium]|nr:hypothetical protein [Blastocatellia bacterium]